MPLRRVWIASPNKSSRGGSGVRLVVIHTAEGARGYRALGNFFANPSSQVSSHVGIDDEHGVIGEYVKRPEKSWTQSAFNPQAVSAELCAAPKGTTTPCGANWSRAEWLTHGDMLQNTADWIREECQHFGLPIVKLSAGQAQGSGRGVCGHVDLGQAGGGHSDPGPNFPWSEVMDLARRGGPPPSTTSAQEDKMIATATASNGNGHFWRVLSDGSAVDYTWKGSDGAWHPVGASGWMSGMARFAAAPSGHKIQSIDAVLDGRVLTVYIRTTDGSSWVTWQAPNSNTWQGSQPGKIAAFQRFAK
jgi:hypothetical protein